MLNLFKKTPVLEEESIQWLFNAYGWALTDFGSDVFFQQTRLIEPSREFFPGGGDSAEEISALIFAQVQQYCGLQHWPCIAISHYDHDDTQPQQNITQVLHGQSERPLLFFFEPQQVANPDAMIANYAHAFGHHLGALAQHRPPCDDEQWPHMAELLAIYMGFGIMMVNSARPQKAGGCGSCRNPAAERQGFLTEAEAAYALAIFCVLKEIPAKQGAAHLKSYMRSYFKKAYQDVVERQSSIQTLRAIDSRPHLRGDEAHLPEQTGIGQANTPMQVTVNFQPPSP